MFFEGTEKKFELTVDSSVGSFRELPRGEWDRVVARAGAQILSSISNACCDAYLLSESSLFVFDHKVVMLTCGKTTLPDAIVALLEHVALDRVRMLIYERKNEVFPHSQSTSFFDDARFLNAHLPGRAYLLGDEYAHHLHLFHLDRVCRVDAREMTLEVLMYGLDESAREVFCRGPKHEIRRIREETGVRAVLPGFELDDHLFEPVGYSLNGIRGDEYFTVHVTPQAIGSYVSFETNARLRDEEELEIVVRGVLDVFRPRSVDLVLFGTRLDLDFRDGEFDRSCRVVEGLDCGFKVEFVSLHRRTETVGRAVELPLA